MHTHITLKWSQWKRRQGIILFCWHNTHLLHSWNPLFFKLSRVSILSWAVVYIKKLTLGMGLWIQTFFQKAFLVGGSDNILQVSLTKKELLLVRVQILLPNREDCDLDFWESLLKAHCNVPSVNLIGQHSCKSSIWTLSQFYGVNYSHKYQRN